MEKNNERKNDTIINAGLASAQAEVVQRYGEAVKVHLVSHGGYDNETATELSKSLMKIFGYKINPDYAKSNIKQQAGFSAEVKTAAIEDAERIIKRDKSRKVTRTDDMKVQSDGKGNDIGGTNDKLYDIAEVDLDGNYIEGSARQLKYVGETPKECADGLLNKKWDKYRDADIPIEVPADFYDKMKIDLAKKEGELKKQIAAAEEKGKTDLAIKKKAELERVEKTSANLKKGKLTKDEAIKARLRPTLSTAKDILKVSHRSGIEAAKSGVAIGGGISFIRNAVAVLRDEKEPIDAVADVVCDTAGAGTLSYATGFCGAAIKGAMQNAPTKYVRALSKTNLPGIVVTVTWETGKTLKRYADGEIDGTECLTELGEKGTGMLASAAGATLGQLLIPIPIVGGLIGGMVGYAMASSYYNQLVDALNDAKLGHEERLRIEAECHEAIIAITEYRMEMELAIQKYLHEYTQIFEEAIFEIETAYNTGDVGSFISGAVRITKKLGGEPLFETKKEFDEKMKSDEPFVL
jgi:uncharacterized protein (DUF697 family)